MALLLVGCAEDRSPPPLIGDPANGAMVFFAFDSADLTDQSLAEIKRFGGRAIEQAKKGNRVLICAHADRAGSSEANLVISQRRGDAVRQAFIDLGVPGDHIVVLALGDTAPLGAYAANPRAPFAGNRRVEFEFERAIGLGGGCIHQFELAKRSDGKPASS
jgi:outer membrane protein OmpA-like peptidoglycan-associated protein